jgi:hypothetical protein
MKAPLAILAFMILVITMYLGFFLERRYDCSKGSTSCTREKLWLPKE